jgi:hypothetical protein
LAEFGIIRRDQHRDLSAGEEVQLPRTGCWRVGTHPAARGQFSLCYRHHPDFQERKPTHEMIARLHREHAERQAAIQSRLAAIGQPVSPHQIDG